MSNDTNPASSSYKNYFRQRLIESENRVENAVKLLAAASEDTKRLDWMDEYEAEVQKYEESEDGSKRYEVWFFVGRDPSPVFSAPTLREAIDAARNSCRRKSLKR